MGSSIEFVAFLSLLFVGCAVTNATDSSELGQDYPAKPVRIIEPFGMGGGPDLLARALALKLSDLWDGGEYPRYGSYGGPCAGREVTS
jgi:tripartite-type tricarboxylate transporter receptor subunit TctC